MGCSGACAKRRDIKAFDANASTLKCDHAIFIHAPILIEPEL